MRKLSRPTSLSLVFVVAVGAVGCNKSPTRPGTDFPGGPSILGGPSITSLEIVGPARIAPEGTAQFSIATTWSDHVPREVSSGVIWTSSQPAVLAIDSLGRATAREPGLAHIGATAGGRSALVKIVLVLPDGTFWLSGSVTDGRYPVDSAVVEAVSGTDTVAARTGADGRFDLYGVRRDAALRVTKDGYATHEQNLQLTDHGSVRVTLALAQPRAQIAGTYILTIGSPQCADSSPLAEELRQRTYTAVVTQSDERVSVSLAGKDFASGPGFVANQFAGVVTPTGAWFVLWQGDIMDPPQLIERLATGTFLTISGRAVTTVSDSGLQGTLAGALFHHEGMIGGRIIGSCTSATHSFTLAR